MLPDSATVHAAMQTEIDIGKFIAAVIGIVTAVLVLCQKAFGRPRKGDHRSAALLINSVLMVVFLVAAYVAASSMGMFSSYTATLFGLTFLTWIFNFFLEAGPPTRLVSRF